jgi:hypothetical protein
LRVARRYGLFMFSCQNSTIKSISSRNRQISSIGRKVDLNFNILYMNYSNRKTNSLNFRKAFLIMHFDLLFKIVPSYFTHKFKWIRYRFIFNKYKTFSVLIDSYINTSGNWENEKLCGNTRTTPEGRSVFTQFRVFPISTSIDITVYRYGKNIYICFIIFYNIYICFKIFIIIL